MEIGKEGKVKCRDASSQAAQPRTTTRRHKKTEPHPFRPPNPPPPAARRAPPQHQPQRVERLRHRRGVARGARVGEERDEARGGGRRDEAVLHPRAVLGEPRVERAQQADAHLGVLLLR